MSDNVRWLRIKQLFQESQEQQHDERHVWLVSRCGGDKNLLQEVQALLDAQQGSHNILDDSAIGALNQLSIDGNINLVGKRIGTYRLLRLLGEGGMGSVYLAERDEGDVNLRAALKLIRADVLGDDARRRFLRERRILSQLAHPHIAQLHDAGMTQDGSPYFTLEYIEGDPITKYSDAHRLTVRDRLRLVLQVCAAVDYAHRNLIVHRDLKPSNIYVTADGQVKLLDFGIAKLLDEAGPAGETATQSRMMTPEYAAPEQVLGEPITTATDVYAIGVLIYELLSGRLPYARADGGSISWSKAVVEDIPEPVYRAPNRNSTRGPDSAAIAAARNIALPTLRRQLRGDIDRILQRALAKSPESRYGTVSALTADIAAYLNGNAISGGTRSYQFRKFVRRHWFPLAAAATIFLVLLVSGTAIVWQAHQLARASQNNIQVKDFLFGLFTAVDPHFAKGKEVSARELLDRGATGIERNKSLDAEQKAEIESVLGRIYWQLALYEPANKLQGSAIAVLRTDNQESLLLAMTEADRATTLADLGDITPAEVLADEARRGIDLLPNASLADRARVLHAQGIVAGWKRDFPKANEIAGQEVVLARQIADTDPKVLYRALMSQGVAEWGLTHIDDAESSWREALSIVSRDAAEDDLDVAMARRDVANALQTKSRYAEAEPFLQQVVSTEEKVLGSDHPSTMSAHRDLALTEYRLGHYAKGRTMMEQVIAAQRTKLGVDHPAVAGSEINLGYLLIDSGDIDTAEKVLTESVAIFQKKYDREYQGTRAALRVLAVAHTQQGKLELAEQELNEVNDQEVKLGLRENEGDETDRDLGDVKRLRGESAAAVKLTQQALAISVKKHGEDSRYAADAHEHLGLALRESGDTTGAEREFRASLVSRASYLSNAEDPSGATTRLDLGLLLVGHPESRAEGIRLLSEAAALREKFLGISDPLTKQAQSALRNVAS